MYIDLQGNLEGRELARGWLRAHSTPEQLAFLLPETTMGQRIVRAKQRLREAGARFALPAGPEREPRLAVVLAVLYLIFNEGYAATAGDDRAGLPHIMAALDELGRSRAAVAEAMRDRSAPPAAAWRAAEPGLAPYD